MEEWTIKTPNPKCRLFLKIGLLMDFAALCWTDFIGWKYIIQSWVVFSTQLVNCCHHGRRNYTCVLLPPTFSLTSPPFPLPKVNIQYQTVRAREGGGGVLSCVGDHILQEFTTLFLTKHKPYKISTPPQTKMTSKDDIYRLVSLKGQ